MTSRADKKTTYARTQQLATAVLRPVIRIFGRALHEQPEGFVVDPFMGTGSTAMAAHQLGCGFFGWDRDATVVLLATTKVKKILKRLISEKILVMYLKKLVGLSGHIL